MSVFDVLYSIVTGYSWSGFILFPVNLCIGLLGFYAGFTGMVSTAKKYYFWITITTIFSIVVKSLFLLFFISLSWENMCERQEIKISDCDENSAKVMFLTTGLLGIFFTLSICSFCICTARKFYNTLLEESLYDNSPNVYTTSAGQSNSQQPHYVVGDAIYAQPSPSPEMFSAFLSSNSHNFDSNIRKFKYSQHSPNNSPPTLMTTQ